MKIRLQHEWRRTDRRYKGQHESVPVALSTTIGPGMLVALGAFAAMHTDEFLWANWSPPTRG